MLAGRRRSPPHLGISHWPGNCLGGLPAAVETRSVHGFRSLTSLCSLCSTNCNIPYRLLIGVRFVLVTAEPVAVFCYSGNKLQWSLLSVAAVPCVLPTFREAWGDCSPMVSGADGFAYVPGARVTLCYSGNKLQWSLLSVAAVPCVLPTFREA